LTDRKELIEMSFKKWYESLNEDAAGISAIGRRASDGGYICPACGNGSGSEGTGIHFNEVGGEYLAHCFKCDRTFGYINYIKAERHCDYSEAVDIAKKIVHGEYVSKKTMSNIPKPTESQIMEKVLEAEKHLEDFGGFVDGKYRAISLETYKKYSVGYSRANSKDATRKYYLYEDGFERLILPSDNKQHYLARFVGSGACVNLQGKDKSKVHAGQKDLFGLKNALSAALENPQPIFVVEGEFDALSLAEYGFAAVATSGQPPKKASKSAVYRALMDLPKNFNYILLPDNDGGRTDVLDNFNSCAVMLRKAGYMAISIDNVAEYFGKKKDVNELLQADTDNFPNIFKRIIADTSENFKRLAENISKQELGEETEVDNEGNFKVHKVYAQDKYSNAPINLRLPGGYGYGKFGIYDAKGKLITSTPILITKIYQTEGGTDKELQLTALVNGVWKNFRHIIAHTTLTVPSKLTQALAREGISVVGGGRDKKLAEYLNDLQFAEGNLDLIPTCTLYKQPGWTDSTCTKFVYPPGDGESYVVKHRNTDYKAMFGAKGDPILWKKYLVKLYKSSYAARLTLGASLAAPTLRILGVRNLQFHLNAPSGKGKSALLKGAMSIYGNPEEMKNTFNATLNALDLVSPVYSDLPLWVDELQSAPKRLLENISDFVYHYDDGKTKFKLDKESEFKEQLEFRGVRITTGEMSLLPDSTGQGAMRRLIELNLTHCLPESLAKDIHESGVFRDNHGHYGKAWCDYLAAHKSDILASYRKFRFRYSSEADYLMGDYHSALAAAHSSLKLFCDFLGLGDALDVENQCIADAQQLFKILPSTDYSRNSIRALQYVEDMVNIHFKNFAKCDENNYVTNNDGQRETWGYTFQNGDVAIFPTALKNFLSEHGFPSTDAILKDLNDRGQIIVNGGVQGGHRYMRRMKFGDNYQWVIYFKAEAFAPKETPASGSGSQNLKYEAATQIKDADLTEIAQKASAEEQFDFKPKILSGEDFIMEDDPEGKYYEWLSSD